MKSRQVSTIYNQDTNESNEYDLSESEKSKFRASALYTIRMVVEKYNGTMKIDLATYTFDIDVPDKNITACEKEIEEQMSFMYR